MTMKTKRSIKLFGIVFLILLALSAVGCLRPVSLEDCGYVITVGVDGGKAKRFQITLMLQRENSGQSGDGEGGAILLSAEGKDIFDAISEIESNAPYVLNFSRTSFMAFGKAAAQNGLMKEFLDVSLETLRIKSSSIVLIAEGEAMELIGGMSANDDANITKLQTALLNDRERLGTVAFMSVSRYYEAVNEGRFDFCTSLARYEGEVVTDMGQKKSESEGEDPIESEGVGDHVGGLKAAVCGTALFDGARFVGELDRNDTVYLNMAKGDFTETAFTLEMPDGGTATVVLEKKKSRIIVEELKRQGGAAFKVVVELYVSVHAGSGLTAEEIESRIATELTAKIERGLASAFEKCRAANCDAFGLGTELSKKFSSVREWEEYDWKSRYPYSETTFEVILYASDHSSAEETK